MNTAAEGQRAFLRQYALHRLFDDTLREAGGKQRARRAFLDAGSVWGQSGGVGIEGNCDGASDCLRYSTGVGVSWYSPFGPIKLVLAKPLNEQEGDKTEVLQFQLGSQF